MFILSGCVLLHLAGASGGLTKHRVPLAITIVVLTFSGILEQEVLLIPVLYSLFVVLTATVVTLGYRWAYERKQTKIPELL